ncbi:MAG: hypothetical protein KJZ75_13180 [Hyphomonadaceae bacterium]|nr:hypothetical protein [Hyphomonadaceae bacterium]
MSVAALAFAVGVLCLVALAVVSLRSERRRRNRLTPGGGPIIPVGHADDDGDDGGADG